VARDVQQGSFQARVVTFDARSGVVELVMNPALRNRIPAPALSRVDSVRARIHAGTLSGERG
jgi:hypothetical protein